MDQRQDFLQLSRLVDIILCNTSDPDSSIYNFSRTMALDLITEYKNNMFTVTSPTTIALLCLYIPTFFLALSGNLLVIFVVSRNAHMKRVKNLFLVNLSIADICVTVICIPMVSMETVYRLWIYGKFMCKISGYVQGVAVACSIFTLCALSIDRYLAIKCPTSLKRIAQNFQAIRVLVFVWILSAIFASPLLYIRTVKAVDFKCLDIHFTYCIEDWSDNTGRQAYGIMILVIIYVAPLSIIAVCYGLIGKALCSSDFQRKSSDGDNTNLSGRKRVARMLIALIIVFVVSWFPFNVCSLSLDVKPRYFESQIFVFALWLGHAHSAINPLLYWFFDKSFRHCMRRVIFCQSGKNRHRGPQPAYNECDFGDIFRYKHVASDSRCEYGFLSTRTRRQNTQEYEGRHSRNWIHSTLKHSKRKSCLVQEPCDLSDPHQGGATIRRNPHAPDTKAKSSVTHAPTIDAKGTSRYLRPAINIDVDKHDSPSAQVERDQEKKNSKTTDSWKRGGFLSASSSTQPTSPSSGCERYGFRVTHSVSV